VDAKKTMNGANDMKILLATDGSKYSAAAAQKAITWIHSQGVEVLVLQVLEPLIFSTPPQMARGYAPEMAERLREKLKEARKSVEQTAELFRKAGFRADSRVIENETRTGILEAAAKWHADLIVLGSHGEKGLRKFLLGSVAEFVARHARCSVLISRSS
jgi:nucleotide-binding universal stress UspA family protein